MKNLIFLTSNKSTQNWGWLQWLQCTHIFNNISIAFAFYMSISIFSLDEQRVFFFIFIFIAMECVQQHLNIESYASKLKCMYTLQNMRMYNSLIKPLSSVVKLQRKTNSNNQANKVKKKNVHCIWRWCRCLYMMDNVSKI